MAKPLDALRISSYKKLLSEYSSKYFKLLKGNIEGPEAYNDLSLLVVNEAKYITMVESLYPQLTEYKPTSYKAIYKNITKS